MRWKSRWMNQSSREPYTVKYHVLGPTYACDSGPRLFFEGQVLTKGPGQVCVLFLRNFTNTKLRRAPLSLLVFFFFLIKKWTCGAFTFRYICQAQVNRVNSAAFFILHSSFSHCLTHLFKLLINLTSFKFISISNCNGPAFTLKKNFTCKPKNTQILTCNGKKFIFHNKPLNRFDRFSNKNILKFCKFAKSDDFNTDLHGV